MVLAGCAVPHERGDLTLRKNAARGAEVTAVFNRYRAVRNIAVSLLDPKPLSTVESDAVLAIDSGSFQVSQRLAKKQKKETSALDVVEVLTPRFSTYPLWFVAVVRDPTRRVNRVQVFQRDSAVDPWLLVASPETVAETSLPGLQRDGGDVVIVKPGNATGLLLSPQAAAAAYAKALADGSSDAAHQVVSDSFVSQMRSAASSNAGLKGVTFTQSWSAEKVRFALRTSDGGALVFATLLRSDTYKVKAGLTVNWPKGSPQQAFLSDGISGSGTLRYQHQVLLYLPGKSGKPRAIGQYGGVVGADGA